MFIEKIIISGFRSFKNCEIIDLSPGQNVFIGPNGSGKSNIVLALDFVLTKNHHHLNSEQKTLLLCRNKLNNSTTIPSNVLEGFVEIHLNNQDGYFPFSNKSIVIKRQISYQYDHYFINNQRAKMSEVMTLLESGGFTPDNSYYLIQQGLISRIVVSDDRYRLDILRSISGAKSFDEKRNKAIQLINESEEFVKKVEQAIETIRFNLSLLGIDENKIQKYDRLCKLKKYTLALIKQNQLKHRKNDIKQHEFEIQKLSRQLDIEQKKSFNYRKASNEKQKELEKITMDIRDLQNQFDSSKFLLNSLMKQLNGLHQQTSLSSQETDETIYDSSQINSLQDELQQLVDKHQNDQLQLSELIEKEAEINAQLKSLTNKRSMYHNLINLLQSSHSATERNQFIEEKFLKMSDSQIEETRTILIKCRTNLQKLKMEKNEIEKRIKSVEDESQSKIKEKSILKKEITDLVCRNKLNEINICKVINELNLLQKESITVENDLKEVENRLNLNTSAMAITSKRSIETVLNDLKASISSENLSFENVERIKNLIQGYYGQLVDCFELIKPVDNALETLMKNKIFYHLVRDENIATELLDEITKRNLTGSFQFVAINRIESLNKDYSIKKDGSCDRCEELYNCIKNLKPNSEEIECALKTLFNGLFIARSFQDCFQLFQNSKGCDFATLDGELIDRHGVATKVSPDKPTKFQLYRKWSDFEKKLQETKQKIQQLEEKRDQMIKENSLVNQQLISKREKLSSFQDDSLEAKLDQSAELKNLEETEKQIKSVRNDLNLFETRLSCLIEEKNFWQQKLTQEQSNVGDLENLLQESSEQINALNKELHLNAKQRSLKELQIQNDNIKINDMKEQLNKMKHSLLNQKLSTEKNLKIENIEKKLTDQIESIKKDIHSINQKMISLEQDKCRLETELDAIKEQYDHYLNQYEMTQKQLQSKKQEIENIDSEIEQAHIEFEQSKLINFNDLIRNELPKSYQNMETLEQMNRTLIYLNKKIKELGMGGGNVNKDRLNSYRGMQLKMNHLIKARDQSIVNLSHIRNLIQLIEQKKDEYVMRTYKQVNFHFKQIFKQFVPNGCGSLRFITKHSANNQPELSESFISNLNSSIESTDSFPDDQFKGLGISVSFVDPNNPDKDLTSLSGGQKAMVALTFVFALQQVDPMPFYIFDEVDQSLDQSHRIIIAEMIRKQVIEQKKQFLITTFRTEFVQQADKVYGVKNINGLSYVQSTNKEDALDYLSRIQQYNSQQQ